MLTTTFKHLALLLPISVIGLWRWSYWLARKFAATFYRPQLSSWPADLPKPTVSIVTPVYNEDPTVFIEALDSWISNGVTEIVAVIDKTNVRQIMDYETRYRDNPNLATKCRLIVTPKPGKRAALCDGIEAATGDIIALVDSDTIWDDHVLAKTLPYFGDKAIGGATVAQRIRNPNTMSNVIFDMLLWNRYHEEIPFLLGVGYAFNTLSGRTAFYRRSAIMTADGSVIHSLRHEFFMGTRGVSGDDKRLTHLILEQGWHIAFVVGPTVYTQGLGRIDQFLKQRLRWTRNSWRADLRAITKGWVWNHPALALFMLDRFIQPFFMLIGPLVFVLTIVKHAWLFAGILATWWLVSRFVRLNSYFRAYPSRLIYLPAWIVYTYVNALIKIYALATLVEHSWATRWHAGRAKKNNLARKTLTIGAGATAVVLALFAAVGFISYSRALAASDVGIPQGVNAGVFRGEIDLNVSTPQQPPLPPGTTLPTGVQSYTVAPGDTLDIIARKLGVNEQRLKNSNGIHSPHRLKVGTELIYFTQKGTSGN